VNAASDGAPLDLMEALRRSVAEAKRGRAEASAEHNVPPQRKAKKAAPHRVVGDGRKPPIASKKTASSKSAVKKTTAAKRPAP
jgi:hypothetical protein